MVVGVVLATLVAVGGGSASGAVESATAPVTAVDGSEQVELTTADADAWLDGLVPAALEREGIVGATIAIVRGGEIVTQRGFGLAHEGGDGGARVAVDPASTLFRIGSVSKLVTATAVMQLVDEGVLDLDAPAQDYLDEPLAVRFEDPVTLRHLLTHTAGFEDDIAGVIVSDPSEMQSLHDAVFVDPPEQIFEPGRVPSYSNYSDGVAAYIVELASGRPFAEYTRENIFERAGMAGATLEQPLPTDREGNMSAGYTAAESAEVPFELVTPAPAGAISATATDMAAFMNAQLGHAGPGGPLLSPAAFDVMQAPGLDEDDIGGLAKGPRMAIGFFEDERHGHPVLSHAGDLTAFHAQLEIYPEDDTGFFVSVNSTGFRGDSSTALREALAAGFADRYFADERSEVSPTATAAEHAASVGGSYLVSRRGESTFVRLYYLFSTVDVVDEGAGILTVSAITDTSGAPTTFVEVEPWVWQEVGGDRRVAVDRVDGVVTAIGLNPAFTLQPAPGSVAALPLVAMTSLAILVTMLVSWPVAALMRRWWGIRRPTDDGASALRWWVRGSLVALAAAGVLWVVVAQPLLGSGPTPPVVLVRLAQAATALAVSGVVPAGWLLVRRVRELAEGSSLRRWVGASGLAMSTYAFLGLGYVAIIGGLLQPSTSI